MEIKSLLLLITVVGLHSIVYGRDPNAAQLPDHSSWIEIESGDFAFRVSKIDVTLKVSEIESPPPKDFSKLENCATWFVHHWEHTESHEGLRSLLELDDEFQTADPFERLSDKDRSPLERSYSHIIDYRGFYFLLGIKRGKDGSTGPIAGAYRWDAEAGRFFAILNTPTFRNVSGRELWADLFKLDLDALSMKEDA